MTPLAAGPAPVPGEPEPIKPGETVVSGTCFNAAVQCAHAEPRPLVPSLGIVNGKQIRLNYQIKDVGPSGVSDVELWYTRDGKNWQKYDSPPQHQPPFIVKLSEDGLYGFTLLARNGIGLGRRPPQADDLPQVMVEVDMTRPVVELVDSKIEAASATPSLTITWKATDKNLGPQPISLFYAETNTGPWTPIAMRLENTGNYLWKISPKMPSRFWLRVQATDLAGNLGLAQTSQPILLDLMLPSVSILGLEPGDI